MSVFTQQGVDSCSIEDITELADVGKGTFYRHFHDKTAILNALSEAALRDLADAIREHVSGALSYPDALDRIQTSETAWCLKRADCFRLLLQAQVLLVVRPKVMASLQPPFRALFQGVEALLRPLAPTGTDDAVLRRTVLATVSAPFGVLALKQAVLGIGPTDAPDVAPGAVAPTDPRRSVVGG